MNFIFLTGLIGSFVLVAGAAWPEASHHTHPARSLKNLLFAAGGVIMLVYALLGYFEGGPFFFVILEILVVIANILMLLNTPDRIDLPVIGAAGLGLVLWSLYLFEGYATIIFVVGLCVISLGYALQPGSLRRSAALTGGSLLIALFSFIEASWVFFWLNVFFALFSAYYLVIQARVFFGHRHTFS